MPGGDGWRHGGQFRAGVVRVLQRGGGEGSIRAFFRRMHPELITIFGKTIYTYGFLAMLGLLAAVGTWSWLGRKEKAFGGDMPTSLAIWLMVPGILGARAAYVVANWGYFSTAPGEMVRIDHGGLIFYGGFAAACLSLALYARLRRMPAAALFDFAAPGLAIGHAFGRLGCLAFGCCHGAPLAEGAPRWLGVAYPACTPMGQVFPGIPLYATQAIEAAGLVAIWACLVAFRAPLRKRPGTTSAAYLLAYAPLRFGVEFLRGDVRQPGWFGLDVAQTVSIGLFVLGGALLALALAGRCGKAAEE